MSTLWATLKPNPHNLRVWQLALLLAIFVFWHAMTTPGLLPNLMFENDQQAAFFFGEPIKVLGERDGFPQLEPIDLYLHLAGGNPQEPVRVLRSILLETVRHDDQLGRFVSH